MRVEIYSDVVCPWCYIGLRRFSQALAAFPGAEGQSGGVEAVFRPFQLDPAAPDAPRPLLDVLRDKFGPQVAGMLRSVSDAAGTEGIAIDWDAAVAVNTLTAHRLLRLAERTGGPSCQRAVAEALFDAHFARGADIADPAVLADLAAGAGLDGAGLDRAAVHAALASDEGAAEVRADIAAARRLGVRAVPTFVFDGRLAVQGAQPAPVLLRALEQAAGAALGPAAGAGGRA